MGLGKESQNFDFGEVRQGKRESNSKFGNVWQEKDLFEL